MIVKKCSHGFQRVPLYVGVLWYCVRCPFQYIREPSGSTWPSLDGRSWWMGNTSAGKV
jgi:hypothetical protein